MSPLEDTSGKRAVAPLSTEADAKRACLHREVVGVDGKVTTREDVRDEKKVALGDHWMKDVGRMYVREHVEDNGKGTVRILSGGGGVLYTPGKDLELFSLPRHIGGTLIEWTLPV